MTTSEPPVPSAEPATTVSTPSASEATPQNPLIITDPVLLPHLRSNRVARLNHTIPIGSASLTAPTASPKVSADRAYQATEQERVVSGYFDFAASFDVVLASYGHDAGAPATPAILVYDFIVNGATCYPSSPTTAPPGAPPVVTHCTVHVLVDADTGTLLLKSDSGRNAGRGGSAPSRRVHRRWTRLAGERARRQRECSPIGTWPVQELSRSGAIDARNMTGG